MFENNLKVENVKKKLADSFRIIRQYDWLINSYVLDFYVENHWKRLPKFWRINFNTVPPERFSDLLRDGCSSSGRNVWPLSIICLKTLITELCISRRKKTSIDNDITAIEENSILKNPKLKTIFTKCVKPKKRHETEEMAKICSEVAHISSSKYIVDFGAGLGHLARILSYGYGLNVCCLEMESQLNDQARIIDEQLEYTILKYLPEHEMRLLKKPIHKTLKLTKETTAAEFTEIVRNFFLMNNETVKQNSFGIVGLHPCGDLATILLRLFLECKEAKFINLVGCCYMKLTTELTISETKSPENRGGYPLSEFLKRKKDSFLSYEAREISCHAIEMYEERLRKGDYEHLKIHSYRAALEKILMKHWPHLKHVGLRSVKNVNTLSFEEYCKKAVSNLNIEIPNEDIQDENITKGLRDWRKVVIFYTLRLMLAPLVESVILYDRILYLLENGCSVNIDAIFDSRLSPRNHITTAMKHNF